MTELCGKKGQEAQRIKIGAFGAKVTFFLAQPLPPPGGEWFGQKVSNSEKRKLVTPGDRV